MRKTSKRCVKSFCRVIGAGGSLTGYAGGLDKKEKLLALEKADITRFFIPHTETAL